MGLQNAVLNEFYEIYNQPSYREIANITGIQFTRVFRLYNGNAMKVQEYEVFKKKIESKNGKSLENWESLIHDSLTILSRDFLQELESILKRKIRVAQLQNKLKGGEVCVAS